MKPLTEKFRRQRKFLLVLPLLTLPFVTLTFWSLGGGQGTEEKQPAAQNQGFNTRLPKASLRDGKMDKMSLYNMAEKDSQALREARMQDPYADYMDTLIKGQGSDTHLPKDNFYTPPNQNASIQNYRDPNELRVQKKLNELEKALNTSSTDTDLFSGKEITEQANYEDTEETYAPLAKMMADMPDENQPDPELKQLDGMLEKILDIQHPRRVSEQLKKQSEKEAGRVFPVTTAVNTGKASLLERPYIPQLSENSGSPFISDLQQNAFYDLTRQVKQGSVSHLAIPAVIHETQTLVSGATVKLRLKEDVYINGMLIPKNTFVFGNCEVSGERLHIQIRSIRYGHHIFPVSLSVYDMDGIEGIKVPGAMTRNAVKKSSGQALESLQLMSLEPSLGERAAGAGIEAVKGLLSKKAKLVQVTVKAGYPVLLVDKKSMQR